MKHFRRMAMAVCLLAAVAAGSPPMSEAQYVPQGVSWTAP